MDRRELITRIQVKLSHIPAAQVKLWVKGALMELSYALAAGERVEIRNFGVFSVHNVKERTVRNPKSGSTIKVPARKKIHFKPGKELKNRVNNATQY